MGYKKWKDIKYKKDAVGVSFPVGRIKEMMEFVERARQKPVQTIRMCNNEEDEKVIQRIALSLIVKTVEGWSDREGTLVTVQEWDSLMDESLWEKEGEIPRFVLLSARWLAFMWCFDGPVGALEKFKDSGRTLVLHIT